VKYPIAVVLRFCSRAAPRKLRWLHCRRPCVSLVFAVAMAAALMGLGVHINLSASAPRGLYRAVAGTPLRGMWVAACVSADAAAVGLARGYLRPGPCPGGTQPILKPVVAVSGDVVDLSPYGLAVNGASLPDCESASIDSNGRPLAHATWGRHVVGADQLWLVSTRVPNSWDSRYVGPFLMSQVLAIARPVWTVESPGWRR
jgi:conjugative transfer signal peptidase TraF